LEQPIAAPLFSKTCTHDRLQKEYYASQGQPMLLDYARRELADGSRTVVDTHLTVRVWVGAAHRCPFIFKDLYPRIAFSKVRALF
jgi:galactose-1-phosphate uridylyltransferase